MKKVTSKRLKGSEVFYRWREETFQAEGTISKTEGEVRLILETKTYSGPN